MILLLDAGNTRLKWGIEHAGQRLAGGALFHDEIDRLPEHLSEHLSHAQPSHARFSRILGANVAGLALAQRLTDTVQAFGPAPEWLVPSAACAEVRNGYTRPEQLGADRWAALIGARAVHRGPALVVMAGTATTIDVLTHDGLFAGGLIVPGEHLMRDALARHTAQLGLSTSRYAPTPPTNTADAIASGCRVAQLGAIEHMFARFTAPDSAHGDALCLLSGGDAEQLEAALAIPCRRIDDLVLLGLSHIAALPDY